MNVLQRCSYIKYYDVLLDIDEFLYFAKAKQILFFHAFPIFLSVHTKLEF